MVAGYVDQLKWQTHVDQCDVAFEPWSYSPNRSTCPCRTLYNADNHMLDYTDAGHDGCWSVVTEGCQGANVTGWMKAGEPDGGTVENCLSSSSLTAEVHDLSCAANDRPTVCQITRYNRSEGNFKYNPYITGHPSALPIFNSTTLVYGGEWAAVDGRLKTSGYFF